MGSFDAGYGSSIMSRLVIMCHFFFPSFKMYCFEVEFKTSLFKQVGPKKAREMWFLSRFYTAVEAEKMGLVNTVVPVS